MAFHWRANDGPTLNAVNSFVIIQEIWTIIAKKPYIFWFSEEGPVPLCPHSGSVHVFKCTQV